MNAITSVTVFTASTGRRYVDTADLEKVCGISARELDLKHRPMCWGSPRDFIWDGRRMWFAIVNLGQLADGLFASGRSDEAIKLREWSAEWTKTAVAEERKGAVAAPVKGWAQQWEEQHS